MINGQAPDHTTRTRFTSAFKRAPKPEKKPEAQVSLTVCIPLSMHLGNDLTLSFQDYEMSNKKNLMTITFQENFIAVNPIMPPSLTSKKFFDQRSVRDSGSE